MGFLKGFWAKFGTKKSEKEKEKQKIELPPSSPKPHPSRTIPLTSIHSIIPPPESHIKNQTPQVLEITSRSHLPARSSSNNYGSIWSLPKDYIGKDLTRVSIPITFHEPLSFLQQLAESMEYIYLIKEALKSNDSVERMELVAAFALSSLSSYSSHLSLPFNPLLHETYELSKSNLGYEFFAEQVSVDPPISAFYARDGNNEFELHGNVEPRIKFCGQKLEYSPIASFTLHLKAKTFDEKYSWHGISCILQNHESGKICISLNETVKINCEGSNLHAEIKSIPASKTDADPMLYGEIIQGKTPIRVLYGNLTHYIASTPFYIYEKQKDVWKEKYNTFEKNGKNDTICLFFDTTLLWNIFPKPSDSKDYYNMTWFSLMLNEKDSGLKKIPRTDTRFRPDIHLFENGDIDAATKENERLEEKQRTNLKACVSTPPLWFSIKKVESAEKTSFFTFNGNYCNRRDFSKSPDIF